MLRVVRVPRKPLSCRKTQTWIQRRRWVWNKSPGTCLHLRRQNITQRRTARFLFVRSVKPKRVRRCGHVTRMAENLVLKSKQQQPFGRYGSRILQIRDEYIWIRIVSSGVLMALCQFATYPQRIKQNGGIIRSILNYPILDFFSVIFFGYTIWCFVMYITEKWQFSN
jgi:hypothetical protein